MRVKLERRKRYIVDKGLQYRLIQSVSWPMAVVLVVAVGLPIELRFLLKNEADLAGASAGLSYFFVATVSFFVFALIAQILIAIPVKRGTLIRNVLVRRRCRLVIVRGQDWSPDHVYGQVVVGDLREHIVGHHTGAANTAGSRR